MPATLTCPSCHRRLTVSDAAPLRLTCPHCLSRILNPAGRDPSSPTPRPMPPALPRPVVELDDEVDRDITINQIVQIVLLSFLGIGLLLALQAAGVYASMAQSQATQSFGSLLLLPVVIIIPAASVVVLIVRRARHEHRDYPYS